MYTLSIDESNTYFFSRESWSRRRYFITQVIVTSCYIANSNFTTLGQVKQVKTLKAGLRIISEKEHARPKFGRGGKSGAGFNNIDDQTALFEFIAMRFAQTIIGNHTAKA